MGRAPCTKETLPDFLKWHRVTRPPLVFRGLTGSQRTPRFWGITELPIYRRYIVDIERFLFYFSKKRFLFVKIVLGWSDTGLPIRGQKCWYGDNLVYDDAFFNQNWAGACLRRWVGTGIAAGPVR